MLMVISVCGVALLIALGVVVLYFVLREREG